MKYLRIPVLLMSVTMLVLISCQKEKSYELTKIPAHGSLQSDLNEECLPKNVVGAFIGAKELTDSNYIEVEVNVTSTGAYSISTDTLNGYYFTGKGIFADAGDNTIKLKATGTPAAAGTNNFLITFDSTFCYVPVTVLPAGTGAALFTLKGSGSSCMNASVVGSYVSGTPLTLSNKVTIDVAVTKVGTYNISTTATNGMVFSASGVFTSTDTKTVTLTGSGTPSNEGTSVISIAAGATSCTFNINVTSVATFDYFPRVANDNWSYQIDDDPNDSLYITATPQTANIIGNTYNIFFQSDNISAGYDSSGYYRKSGSDYFKYFDFGSYVGFDDPYWAEQNFLKDDAAEGTTWTTTNYTGTVGGTSITVRVRFTVSQKDVNVTVVGVSYPNTIVMEERAEQLIGGNWVDITAAAGLVKSYYSRNVGMIRQQQTDLTSGNSLYKLDMRRYTVF